MGYLKKISSLKAKASVQVAINLCQGNDFKEVVLCLEKPTYGIFTCGLFCSRFISDPKRLSVWTKMKEAEKNGETRSRLYNVLKRSFSLDLFDEIRVEKWDAAVDEQCQRLTEELPYFLKHEVHAWINRIALEYLSYCWRQEMLFGVSRYFLMNIFTRGDWTEAGRLDEKKLAEQLLKDERLTVLQRYRIACVYCLHGNILQLWKKLTQEEKQLISGNDNPCHYMDELLEEKVTWEKNHLWTYAVQQAVCDGNQVALMLCWKRLKKDIRQQMVINMALQSLQKWQNTQNENQGSFNWRNRLVITYELQLSDMFNRLDLPLYCSELVCFFLSEMDEEQQLTFFIKAFQSEDCDYVLECFLDWPHQDDFLPTINRLWGIMPKDKYVHCLLTLAGKYCEDYEKENRYYDYRSLLWKLWEETPEDYKRSVFHIERMNSVRRPGREMVLNKGKILWHLLLKKVPFQEKDEALFIHFFGYQPLEDRIAIMHSEEGKNICSLLMQKERWSFVNWLLEECLPKEEIPSFKRHFIQSSYGFKLCFSKLEENREKFLEDLIDWSFELDTEKTQFKYNLVDSHYCVDACKSFFIKGEFSEVERMINFCLSSDEMKQQFKEYFARLACSSLVKDCAWEQMDKILAWSVDADERIRDLKKYLFSNEGIDIHYYFVFIEKQWEDLKCFYEWFYLSPEEIKKIKKETIFTPKVIRDIHEGLYRDDTDELVASLCCCLTDEEMAINLKKVVEENIFTQVFIQERKQVKERLDYLMSELLSSFRKGKTSKESSFMKDKGEKRSIEHESNSPRKLFK